LTVNTHKAFQGIATVAIALAIAGCAGRKEPELLTPEQFAELSVPLDVREFRTSSGSGTQAIFIKLSRLPDGVSHHAEPASIVLDISGPAGPATVDEESLVADSPLTRIRVARAPRVLRLSLDLERGVVPPYSVHVLADWIMIRLDVSGVQG
jgi:hypothetical protein